MVALVLMSSSNFLLLVLDDQRIVLHGHSLGGGVVGELGQHFPECLKISDRSFASLEVEVLALLRVGLSSFMGMACGLLCVRSSKK